MFLFAPQRRANSANDGVRVSGTTTKQQTGRDSMGNRGRVRIAYLVFTRSARYTNQARADGKLIVSFTVSELDVDCESLSSAGKTFLPRTRRQVLTVNAQVRKLLHPVEYHPNVWRAILPTSQVERGLAVFHFSGCREMTVIETWCCCPSAMGFS